MHSILFLAALVDESLEHSTLKWIHQILKGSIPPTGSGNKKRRGKNSHRFLLRHQILGTKLGIEPGKKLVT
jgi:hypothetical protein